MVVRDREVRGAACLLVVIFHALETAPVSPAWKYAGHALSYVRMPLFIALTGFLYGVKRDWQPMTWTGWLKRTRRLAPPFLAATTASLLANAARGEHVTPWMALIYPVHHMWYLQALAVILLLVFLLDRAFNFGNETFWLLAVVASVFSAYSIGSSIAEFAFGRAMWLLPHFLFGAAFGATLRHGMPFFYRSLIYLGACFAFPLALYQLLPGHVPLGVNSLPGTVIGWAAVTVLFYNMPKVPILAWMGNYSFAIYLWHIMFGTIAAFLYFNRLAVTPEWEVAVRFAVGIAGPIGLVIACSKFVPVASIFVGVPKRNAAESTSA